MSIEIERKFLIKGDFLPFVTEKHYLVQGYLCSVPERTVRIRIKDDKGYITVKGKGNASGMSRFEWEKEISTDEANALLALCEPIIIKKYRFIVPWGTHTIEVDEFLGSHKGLVLCEIELNNEHEVIELPEWIGKEVTGDKRYYNSYLSKHPGNI